MVMFYGEFDYKIDEKGRVPVPPKFRNVLKDGVVLTPGAEKCITVYPIPEWKKISTSITSSPLARSKMRKLGRALFATAFSTRIDGQGRIPIPAPLREHAGIADDIVFACVNTYMEIWNKVLWEEEKVSSQEQAWQIIESLEES
jgi:MraZ protein